MEKQLEKNMGQMEAGIMHGRLSNNGLLWGIRNKGPSCTSGSNMCRARIYIYTYIYIY